jgi:hypothetical protein
MSVDTRVHGGFLLLLFCFKVCKDSNIYLGQGKEAKTEGIVEDKTENIIFD